MKCKLHLTSGCVLLAALTGAAQADYLNGFETSEYEAGSPVAGVTDSGTGNTWQSSGTPAANLSITTSTANPASGSQHLRLLDTSTSSPINARLDLANVASTTDVFDFSFKMAMTNPSRASSVIGVTLGKNVAYDNNEDWFVMLPDGSNSRIPRFAYKITAGGTSLSYLVAKTADGTTFASTNGDYFDIDVRIDPVAKTLLSIKLDGVEQLAAGTTYYIPNVTNSSGAPTNPGFAFQVFSGSASVSTIDIDDIQIAVPEPSSMALLALGGALIAFRRRAA